MPKPFRGRAANRARNATLSFCAFTLLFLPGTVSFAPAQAELVEKPGRKVIRNVPPEYPKSLKENHIGGLVRLNVTVLPNGTVTKVDILGGNPILVEAATRAVRMWKYVPAASQTQEDVHIHFSAQ